MSVATELARDGYAVVRGLFPDELVARARDSICAFIGARYEDPATWYAHAPLDWSVVPLHHSQAMWDVRQTPALHALFANLLGTDDLWVTMDRAIFKVPEHAQHPDLSVLHWDLDPRTASALQGQLYLTDASIGEGCFQCAPSLFRGLADYVAGHPGPLVDAPIDVAPSELVDVPLRAGDFIVWDARLPHHGGPNGGERPRVSMAVTMFPAGDDAARAERIACWRERRAPRHWRGWPGQLDPEPGDPATITPLGRRLVGLDR